MAEDVAPRVRRPGVEYVGLLGLLGVAALLRAALLNGRGLWFDEAFSVGVARLPLAQVWQLIARTDAHPPLYYLLLHFWLGLGDSPAVVRSLSALVGILIVLVTWFFAREVGGSSLAAVAGALMAGSTLAIQATVEARMYPLLALLGTTATWLLWRITSAGARPRTWLLYAATMAVALYVHYFAFLLLFGHGLYMLVYRRRGPFLRRFLLAVAAALLLYAPWWPILVQQLAEGRADSVWSGPMPPGTPVNIVALSSFGGYLFGLGGYLLDGGDWSWRQLAVVLPFLALLAAGTVAMIRRDAGRLLLTAWLAPVAILLAVSLSSGVFYAIPRYVSFVQPFFVILMAQGMVSLAVRIRSRAVLALTTAAVVLLNLAVLTITLVDARYAPYDWAGAARHVQARWRTGDAVVFYPQSARVAFGYYFGGKIPSAVTLYSPPWRARISQTEIQRAVPPVARMVNGAPRVWLILTDPTPPGSSEALVASLVPSYRITGFIDFRRVYVLLYVKS